MTSSRANDEVVCSSCIHLTLHDDWACANCNLALWVWHLESGYDRTSRILAIETFTLGLAAYTLLHTSYSVNIPRLRGCRQTSPGEDRKKQLLQSALGLYPRSFVHQAIFPHRSNNARHGSGSFRPISILSDRSTLQVPMRLALMLFPSASSLAEPLTGHIARKTHQASFS